MSGVPVYAGPFGKEQAERLLWRAGFGPRKGEAEALAKLGLAGAVHQLTNPGFERLVGPKPHDDKGHPLAPYSAWGDDHAWWLDRMVRTSRPLVERMTLIWHDWFATSNVTVGSQKLMLQQNDLFRHIGLGSFEGLAMRVTINPAMLLYLNGLNSIKGSPNENYGREMMELFTLGHGSGYTETDVREQARALTGWVIGADGRAEAHVPGRRCEGQGRRDWRRRRRGRGGSRRRHRSRRHPAGRSGPGACRYHRTPGASPPRPGRPRGPARWR